MKGISTILGILAFTLARTLVIALMALATGRFVFSNLPHQMMLGFLAGLFISPVAFQLFKGKWPQIIASSLGAVLFGVIAAAIDKMRNPIPSAPLLGLLLMVGLIWCVCGFLAGWLTVEFTQAIERRRSSASR
jgi:hypothetical protein